MSAVMMDVDGLTRFEGEVLGILREDGPIVVKDGQGMTLAMQLGYDNSMQSDVYRAIRVFTRKGLAVVRDALSGEVLMTRRGSLRSADLTEYSAT